MLTFVIPVAPYHAGIVETAIASVRQQSIPCEVVVIHDSQGNGAGWARNRGLEQVSTPFVSFLDADDWIAPTFAETMLATYQPGHYVYCDYWRDDTAVESPKCAWSGDGRWHVITTLLATDDVRAVGGFDETLQGAEDTDFYYKVTRSGICGIRLAQPLFHYGAGGKRGVDFVTSGAFKTTYQLILERYKGYSMSCCGDEIEMQVPASGVQFEGAVLAQALWQGNRVVRGKATGLPYPRLSYPRTAWVHELDIKAAPNMWRVVSQINTPTPLARPTVQIVRPTRTNVPPSGAAEVGQRLFRSTVTPAPELQPVERAPVQPDFTGILDKARRALG